MLKALQRYVKGDGESSPARVAPPGWDAFADSLMVLPVSDDAGEEEAEDIVYGELCEMMDGTQGAVAQRAAAQAKAKAKRKLTELGLSRKLQQRVASPTPRWIVAHRPKETGDLSADEVERLLREAATGRGTSWTADQLDQLQACHIDAMRLLSVTLVSRLELEAKGEAAGANAAVTALTQATEQQVDRIRQLSLDFDRANAAAKKKHAEAAQAELSFEQDRLQMDRMLAERSSADRSARVNEIARRMMLVLSTEIDLLRTVPFLSDFKDEELCRLAVKMQRCSANKHTNIIEEGEAGDAMFILTEGSLEVFVSGALLLHLPLGLTHAVLFSLLRHIPRLPFGWPRRRL